MVGRDIIKIIQDNNLENAKVRVTATIYYRGDHDCRTTDEVSISENTIYDFKKHKFVPTVDFYIDSNLY